MSHPLLRSSQRGWLFYLLGTALLLIAPFYFCFSFGLFENDAAMAGKGSPDGDIQSARANAIAVGDAAGTSAQASFLKTIALFICTAPFAGYAFAHGRRLRSRTGAEVMSKDARPPVVYFRSFENDDRPAYEGLGAALSPFRWGLTEEEVITRTLQNLGPVVAIGDPTERLPLAGAARFYSVHDEWQTVAHRLLKEAGLVVFRQGLTPGLIWEIERGRRQLEPNKMLLLVPDKKNYEAFRQMLRPALELPPGKDLRGPLIFFDSGWRSVSFKTKAWSNRLEAWSPPMLSKALREFVKVNLKAPRN